MLFFAVGRSFPRGERPTPTTAISGSTPFSVSYAAARYGPKLGAERFAPVASNCGRQNAGWFGSFPMTNCPDLRIDGRENFHVRAEERRGAPTRLELARRVRVDGEDDLETGVGRARDRTIEERLVLDDEGVARHEADADHRLPEAELGHARIQRRAAVRLELGRVVVRAHIGRERDRRSGEERSGENRCQSESPHPNPPGANSHGPQRSGA